MKQNDWALILVVVIISGAASTLLSNYLINPAKSRTEKVEVVEKITSDFTTPSTKYFNKDSINPTKIIDIGPTANPKPFQ